MDSVASIVILIGVATVIALLLVAMTLYPGGTCWDRSANGDLALYVQQLHVDGPGPMVSLIALLVWMCAVAIATHRRYV